MRGAFNGARIYQTLAEPGESYPTQPTFNSDTQADSVLATQIENAPSVWYVKELTDVTWDDHATPEITATDTGKRFYAFNMGNGPVLGGLSLTRGMSRTYFKEGTYLLGWWHNHQLFVIPMAPDYGPRRCHALRKKAGLVWEVSVPAVDEYWINMTTQTHTLTDDYFPFWLGSSSLIDPSGSPYLQFYSSEDNTSTPETGYERCIAGKLDTDVGYLLYGTDARDDYESSPYYLQPGTAWEDPLVDGTNYVSVMLRHKDIKRQVLISVTARRSPGGFGKYGAAIFTALYESPDTECMPGEETYTRTGDTGFSAYNGARAYPDVWSVASTAADQLPESVTVTLVED